MRPPRFLIASGVALAIAAAAIAGVPAPASAGTYSVHFCDAEAGYQPPVGPEWSTRVQGGSAASYQPGASLECSAQPGGPTALNGAGGWLSGLTTPGTMAAAVFTPPPGASIVEINGVRSVALGTASYAEASIFTSSERPLDDTSATRSGAYQFETSFPVSYTSEQLGPDGATSVQFGARCPAALPNGFTVCGSAKYGFRGSVRLSDLTPATSQIVAAETATGATITWSATDEQSGIASVQVLRDGASVIDEQSGVCDSRRARQCSAELSGSVSLALAPGQSTTVQMTVVNAAQDQSTKTVTATRVAQSQPVAPPLPSQAPTPTTQATPSPAPSGSVVQAQVPRVTLSTRVVKRKLLLSGEAVGCNIVTLRLPGRRTVSTPVVAGRYRTSVTRRRGTYVAHCGAVRAKRAAR